MTAPAAPVDVDRFAVHGQMNEVALHDAAGRRLLTLTQVAHTRGVGVDQVDVDELPAPAGWVDRRTPVWVEDDVVEQLVPAELRRLDRWVRHSARKVPLQRSGRAASSTNPATWCSYDQARRSTVGVGFGFVLDGDGIVCIDLDHCIDEAGRLSELADAVVDASGSTWVEISPSGTGLHVWGRAPLERGRRLPGVELYGAGRMMTVTRRPFRAAPLVLGDLTPVVDVLIGV